MSEIEQLYSAFETPLQARNVEVSACQVQLVGHMEGGPCAPPPRTLPDLTFFHPWDVLKTIFDVPKVKNAALDLERSMKVICELSRNKKRIRPNKGLFTSYLKMKKKLVNIDYWHTYKVTKVKPKSKQSAIGFYFSPKRIACPERSFNFATFISLRHMCRSKIDDFGSKYRIRNNYVIDYWMLFSLKIGIRTQTLNIRNKYDIN